MPSYDQQHADCFVYTFKEGLLSPVAHDLRLRVTRFEITLDDAKTQIEARFDTSSLRVDSALKDGVDDANALSAADMAKIAQHVREDVLQSQRHPWAIFRSSAVSARPEGGFDLRGQLALHGVTRALDVSTQLVAGAQRLELTLHQPDFGIQPFRAMLGTLKVRSDVRLSLTLRA